MEPGLTAVLKVPAKPSCTSQLMTGMLFCGYQTFLDGAQVLCDLAAALQVGQIMLTLPNAYSKVGLLAAVPLSIGCACMSLWTMYCLTGRSKLVWKQPTADPESYQSYQTAAACKQCVR